MSHNLTLLQDLTRNSLNTSATRRRHPKMAIYLYIHIYHIVVSVLVLTIQQDCEVQTPDDVQNVSQSKAQLIEELEGDKSKKDGGVKFGWIKGVLVRS